MYDNRAANPSNNCDHTNILSSFLAIWTVISAFLNSEQKKKLIQVKKKDIQKYITADNLWDHMK